MIAFRVLGFDEVIVAAAPDQHHQSGRRVQSHSEAKGKFIASTFLCVDTKPSHRSQKDERKIKIRE